MKKTINMLEFRSAYYYKPPTALKKQNFSTKIQHKISTQKFNTKFQHKNSAQNFNTKFQHKNSAQKFNTKIQHKISTQNFNIRKRKKNAETAEKTAKTTRIETEEHTRNHCATQLNGCMHNSAQQ
jgi:hypothetical protein